MKYVLLDTNIIIQHLANEEAIEVMLNKYQDESYQFVYSVITKTELIVGANSGHDKEFIASLTGETLITVSDEIATLAGYIRREQKVSHNRSIKTPDAIIAATAVHHDAVLLTRDKGMRFAEQYGIKVDCVE